MSSDNLEKVINRMTEIDRATNRCYILLLENKNPVEKMLIRSLLHESLMKRSIFFNLVVPAFLNQN